LADIHPSEIGRIESGRLKPYDPWILRLEKVLGVPGDELFEEVDDIDNGQCG
jgi:ribosome-binding protein aMBF1 (putative translation factor)